MKYDELKHKTDQISEKMPTIIEKMDILQEEMAVVEDALAHDLDDEITAAIEEARHFYEEGLLEASDEKEELERALEELRADIQEAIQQNQEALASLKEFAGTTYGEAFSGTEQIIQERINQLKSLLSDVENATSGDITGEKLEGLSSQFSIIRDDAEMLPMNTEKNSNNDSVSVGANSILQSGDRTKLSVALRNASDEITMRGYKHITSPHSSLEDLKATNPNWRDNSPWDVNCQRCVSAYEARRRGYDVTAAPLLDNNDTLQIMRHPNGWPSVYKGAQLIDCTAASGTRSATLVDEKMAEWGDGARAIVRVRWKMGGGHVFIAERVNGVTKYIDPQHGTENVDHYFNSAKGDGTFCVRIDNLPFTPRIHDCII